MNDYFLSIWFLHYQSGLFSKMKSGVLYRSARHFAKSAFLLKRALCDGLNIRTVIDLR